MDELRKNIRLKKKSIFCFVVSGGAQSVTKNVPITTYYIKLEGLLKLTGTVITGGQGKMMIQNGAVKVNGTVCLQRGKKLRVGDEVCFQGTTYRITRNEQKQSNM